MRVTKKMVSDTEVSLTLIADSDYLHPIKEAVVQRLSSQVKLPGFRAGKAPLNLVEKQLDQAQLQSEFLDTALNRLYQAAIQSEDLRPVANPEVNLKKFVPFSELEFELKVEVVGPVVLPDYTTIKMTKPAFTVTAKEVDDVIKNLRQRVARREDVVRPAQDGDQVMIDFTGRDSQGQPVQGADGKDYPLVLGSDAFIPGFEKNLIGLRAGEHKTFELTFPKDYGVKALASKQVSFDVTVKSVQVIIEPALDDAFAAQAGPFKTLDELKADIKKQLTQEREYEAERKLENELVKEITAKSKVAVPKALVEEQIRLAEQEERRNLSYRGQTWQEHLADEGVSEDQHRERNRPQAEERVKAGLVLAEIAAQEKIQLLPGELDTRIQLLKGQYTDPKMQAELDKPENQQDIASRIITEKTLAKLRAYAGVK